MTPSKPGNETRDEARKERGIDLQAAYAVLIRAYLRRRGAQANGGQPPAGKTPSPP